MNGTAMCQCIKHVALHCSNTCIAVILGYKFTTESFTELSRPFYYALNWCLSCPCPGNQVIRPDL